MKVMKTKPLFALTLGCLLAGTSITASAGHCQTNKMHGKGYHHGMSQGMYGPHGGKMHGKGYHHGMSKGMYGPHGGKMHGKGYHHGTPKGMYSPHGGMYQQKMQYQSNPYVKTGGSYGQSYDKAAKAESKKQAASDANDIVSIAAGSDDFETLVTAVKAAGLVETLSKKGPFTVFAPTDEAFAKIPEDQLAALLEDKEALTKVLTYHVVEGTVSSNAVTKLDSAKTVQGGMLTIDTSDGVKINGARVVKADIQASNGIIHVIDTVILPN